MSREAEINEQIESLRRFWLASPEQDLMRLVTNVASYDPSNPNRPTSYPIDGMSDAEFFGRLTTYPHFAVDGVKVQSNPAECWKGLL